MAHLVALHRFHLFCRLWASWGTYFTVRSHCLCYGYSEKVSSVKFFKYINVKDSHSRRKHDTTAPEAAYNTSPGQDWACHCLIMDGWIHKLNYWLLVDSEGGEVIVCICVPMHSPPGFNGQFQTHGHPEGPWLNLMGCKNIEMNERKKALWRDRKRQRKQERVEGESYQNLLCTFQ